MMSTLAAAVKSSLLARIQSSGLVAAEVLEELNKFDFPGKRQEEWKYSVPPFASEKFRFLEEPEANAALPDKLPEDATRLVFVDGKFQAELSSREFPAGMKVSETGRSSIRPYEENIFGKLNESTTSRFGFQIEIEKNAQIERPVLLIHCQTGNAGGSWIQPFISISAGAHSQSVFAEIWNNSASGNSVANIVNEIKLDQSAHLSWLHFQNTAADSICINQTRGSLAADAQFRHMVLSLGNGFSRNNLDLHIEGKGAHADLFGLSLGNEKSHCDHHSFVHHAAENSTSNQLYKGIFAGKSSGVFNGKILVDQIAQKTNAYQSGRNILLSGDAKVFAKPQLEIFADDVKCSHGATIGQLDEEPLFYLRSRGLDLASARLLLVRAFASEILMEMQQDSLKNFAEAFVIERLDEMTKSL